MPQEKDPSGKDGQAVVISLRGPQFNSMWVSEAEAVSLSSILTLAQAVRNCLVLCSPPMADFPVLQKSLREVEAVISISRETLNRLLGSSQE